MVSARRQPILLPSHPPWVFARSDLEAAARKGGLAALRGTTVRSAQRQPRNPPSPAPAWNGGLRADAAVVGRCAGNGANPPSSHRPRSLLAGLSPRVSMLTNGRRSYELSQQTCILGSSQLNALLPADWGGDLAEIEGASGSTPSQSERPTACAKSP